MLKIKLKKKTLNFLNSTNFRLLSQAKVYTITDMLNLISVTGGHFDCSPRAPKQPSCATDWLYGQSYRLAGRTHCCPSLPHKLPKNSERICIFHLSEIFMPEKNIKANLPLNKL